MSEVQRITVLWPVGPVGYGNQEAVLASEYDAAQSELAALREELAEIKESLAYRGSLLGRTEARMKAAEQRNAVMRYALEIAEERLLVAERHLDLGEDDSINFEPAILAVRAALSQPTESGASE